MPELLMLSCFQFLIPVFIFFKNQNILKIAMSRTERCEENSFLEAKISVLSKVWGKSHGPATLEQQTDYGIMRINDILLNKIPEQQNKAREEKQLENERQQQLIDESNRFEPGERDIVGEVFNYIKQGEQYRWHNGYLENNFGGHKAQVISIKDRIRKGTSTHEDEKYVNAQFEKASKENNFNS